MLDRLHALAEERCDFAFETTLAVRSLVRWFRELQGSGYSIHLVYFWLADPDLAVCRVAERVRMGGHDVPEPTIRLRYERSLQNFFRLYRPLVNSWEVYDNTHSAVPVLVAEGDLSGASTIHIPEVWDEMRKGRDDD
jgi:predicted ABC-type ATPase